MSFNTNQPPVPQQKESKSSVPVLGILMIVLILIAGLAFTFFKIAGNVFVKTTEVVYEPDLAQGAEVSRADLEMTAAILQKRWEVLGYSNMATSFTVADNNTIHAKIPANVDEATMQSIMAMGLVEFVDMEDTYMEPGTKVSTDYLGNSTPGDDGQIHHTIMTNQQFATAAVEKSSNSDNYQISFSLTENGTEILQEFTANNIGKYLAITLDGTVISCPVIMSEISNGEGVIAGNFSKESAESLVAVLSTHPLMVPLK
jgi:preprotein translocase subunit SecD